MRYPILILALAASAAQAEPEIVQGTAPPPADTSTATVYNRVRMNYDAIQRGEKRLFDLSPQEQDEVRELDRRMRAARPPDTRDAHERCLDEETAKLGHEPTALDQNTIEMRCR